VLLQVEISIRDAIGRLEAVVQSSVGVVVVVDRLSGLEGFKVEKDSVPSRSVLKVQDILNNRLSAGTDVG